MAGMTTAVIMSVTAVNAALIARADTLQVVADGKPAATVVCATDVSAQLTAVVAVLRDCVETASSACLRVASEAPDAGNVIHIGAGPWSDAFGITQEGLDDDGFEIPWCSRTHPARSLN
jgi:hypothetical protein